MSAIPRPLFSTFRSVGRKWLTRQLPDYLSRDNKRFEFTVASYNVLADHLMHEHPHLYRTHQQKSFVYDWNYRKQNLLKEITYANADVLCLQEVQEEHFYSWFHPKLKERGYEGIYKRRSGDKRDGCATFYKLDRFVVEQHQLLDFNHKEVPLMDRNNVAILLFLKPRSDANDFEPICVGNTHLLFNKKRGDIKLAQIAYIFAEMDRLGHSQNNSKPGYMPIVLCGDFNSVPFSPFYNFITKGHLEYAGLNRALISGQSIDEGRRKNLHILKEPIFPQSTRLSTNCKWREGMNLNGQIRTQHKEAALEEIEECEQKGRLLNDLALRSSYLHKNFKNEDEITTCHEHACLTVDYIFYSAAGRNFSPAQPTHEQKFHEKLFLSGVLSLWTDTEVQRFGQLPNGNISSDHLMLVSSFVLS